MAVGIGSTAAGMYANSQAQSAAEEQAAAQKEANDKAAKAKAALLTYEAMQDDINAKMADLQKIDTLQAGLDKSNLMAANAGFTKSMQKVSVAANGFITTDGTAVDIQSDTDIKNSIDTFIMKSNVSKQAWGIGLQADDYRAKARYKRLAAQKVLEAGADFNPGQYVGSNWAAQAGTVLGGASQMISQGFKYFGTPAPASPVITNT